jgi:hypothetical protein
MRSMVEGLVEQNRATESFQSIATNGDRSSR